VSSMRIGSENVNLLDILPAGVAFGDRKLKIHAQHLESLKSDEDEGLKMKYTDCQSDNRG